MPPRYLVLSGLLAIAVGSASLAARQAPAPAPAAPKQQQQPAPPPAQGQPAAQPASDQAPPPQPTFRTGINLVRVDCIVTDKKGQPVTDLQQGDFQVWEDGTPQEVTSFKLFKIDALNQTTPARPIRTTFDEESEAQRAGRPAVLLFPGRLPRAPRQRDVARGSISPTSSGTRSRRRTWSASCTRSSRSTPS